MGCLEGRHKDVLAKLARIEPEPRHGKVEVLHHGPLVERRFSRFSTGHSQIVDDDMLGVLKRFMGRRPWTPLRV